jgi:hypothetical protein
MGGTVKIKNTHKPYEYQQAQQYPIKVMYQSAIEHAAS